MNLQYFPMDRQLCHIEIESCKYSHVCVVCAICVVPFYDCVLTNRFQLDYLPIYSECLSDLRSRFYRVLGDGDRRLPTGVLFKVLRVFFK